MWKFEFSRPFVLSNILLKVAFFRKWDSFLYLPISQKNYSKNYPELEIWISCLLIWAGISNFKLRIVFWNNVFGRLGDLKNESHFLKKRHCYTFFNQSHRSCENSTEKLCLDWLKDVYRKSKFPFTVVQWRNREKLESFGS